MFIKQLWGKGCIANTLSVYAMGRKEMRKHGKMTEEW